jgi:hypothetical protein
MSPAGTLPKALAGGPVARVRRFARAAVLVAGVVGSVGLAGRSAFVADSVRWRYADRRGVGDVWGEYTIRSAAGGIAVTHRRWEAPVGEKPLGMPDPWAGLTRTTYAPPSYPTPVDGPRPNVSLGPFAVSYRATAPPATAGLPAVAFRTWSAVLPWWALCAGFVALIGLGLIGRTWRGVRDARGRRPELLCRTCGYDLRATPSRCPECGRTEMETHT